MGDAFRITLELGPETLQVVYRAMTTICVLSLALMTVWKLK